MSEIIIDFNPSQWQSTRTTRQKKNEQVILFEIKEKNNS